MNVRLLALAAIAVTGCAVEDQAQSDVLASEQAPIPQLFNADVDVVAAGQLATFTVTGGPPNTAVRLVRAVNGAIVPGPCPAPLGGECLDINSPAGVKLTGNPITLDGNGDAEFSVVIPTTVPDGINVAFQFVAPANGAGSNPFEITTGIPVIPCPDVYEPNDDAFGTLPAWPLADCAEIAAGGGDFDWYTVDLLTGDALTANIYFTHVGGSVDLDLYLRDTPSDNATYGTGFLARGFSATDDETLSYTSAADATHYVMVHNFSVNPSDVPYDMDAVITPAP